MALSPDSYIPNSITVITRQLSLSLHIFSALLPSILPSILQHFFKLLVIFADNLFQKINSYWILLLQATLWRLVFIARIVYICMLKTLDVYKLQGSGKDRLIVYINCVRLTQNSQKWKPEVAEWKSFSRAPLQRALLGLRYSWHHISYVLLSSATFI